MIRANVVYCLVWSHNLHFTIASVLSIEKAHLLLILYGRYCLRPWSSQTTNSDKKYMELNEAALNVNKPCVTSRKTAFPKDKYCGYPFINLLIIQNYAYSFLNFPKKGILKIDWKFSQNFCTIVSNFSDSSREIFSYISLKFADNLTKNQF